MKLYNSLGPNPRLVRMFLLEKGLDVPKHEIDLLGAENRRPPFTDKNPAGQLPALELDDGTVLTETSAICEYLEDVHPSPPLIGTTPEEKAATRMWTRRIELHYGEPMANGFRYGVGARLFQERIHIIPQAADDLIAIARDGLAWLDRLIAGRSYIAGERFTLADIRLYCFMDFASGVGQAADPALANVAAWFGRVCTRPSAEASLHPAAGAAGARG